MQGVVNYNKIIYNNKIYKYHKCIVIYSIILITTLEGYISELFFSKYYYFCSITSIIIKISEYKYRNINTLKKYSIYIKYF